MNTDQHDWGRERGTLQLSVGQNQKLKDGQ